MAMAPSISAVLRKELWGFLLEPHLLTPLDENGNPLADFRATVLVAFKSPVDRTAAINFVGVAIKAVFTSAFPQVGTYEVYACNQGVSGQCRYHRVKTGR
jgi:hypothetical protein